MAKIVYITKHCSKCNTLKPMEEFHKNKSSHDGHRSVCKACHNESRRTGTSYQESIPISRVSLPEFHPPAEDSVPISPFGTELVLDIPIGRAPMRNYQACPVCHDYDVVFDAYLGKKPSGMPILICNNCLLHVSNGHVAFYWIDDALYVISKYTE